MYNRGITGISPGVVVVFVGGVGFGVVITEI